jgi:formylglycine-generating enzyme required for sulfatase activity
VTPLVSSRVERGSYVLVLSAPKRVPVRYPILMERAQRVSLDVYLPRGGEVLEGLVYIPAGRFLFGSDEPDGLRRGFLNTVPLHEVATGAYLIARRETTFAEWIDFLRTLPPGERARRAPKVAAFSGALDLADLGGDGWRLTLKVTTRAYAARAGEVMTFPGRRRRRTQDWTRFPVSGISWDDAQAYVGWLSRNGRIPGARLCNEHEWERAARGADSRSFPHGDRMEQDDANIDETYGKEPLALGHDEVGAHPSSQSPFGLDDMAGNVWEWTHSVVPPARRVARGGSFYHDQSSSRVANRQVPEPAIRDLTLGMRVCASFPAPPVRVAGGTPGMVRAEETPW